MLVHAQTRAPSRRADRPAALPLFQSRIARAETTLLDLADYIYAHTPLKPMSKVLFVLSRLLLLARCGEPLGARDAKHVVKLYDSVARRVGFSDGGDDYNFDKLLVECERHLPYILDAIITVEELTRGSDAMGLAFNTLLRGKFEAGEGLGTHLTPEEVVRPMVKMAIASVDAAILPLLSKSGKGRLLGDIAGGSGRFVYALVAELAKQTGQPKAEIATGAYLFDQSRLCVELGRINFVLEDLAADHFYPVDDSILSPEVSALRGRFLFLATNPPFGSNKYRWSPALAGALEKPMLRALGLNKEQDRADPAEVFLVRNLDLLASGGVLAIVLPDGILCGNRLASILKSYEESGDCLLSVLALVSLPVATFALGGTVAKTSFAIIRKEMKNSEPSPAIFSAVAEHVGFIKKGNARLPDPKGNDLEAIAEDYCAREAQRGKRVSDWRNALSLSPAWLIHSEQFRASGESILLEDVVEIAREFQKELPDEGTTLTRSAHVSILDVDETGLIELRNALSNRPTTKPLACRPGDILVSCLNPKIWRVALIPFGVHARWTCSPEFAVLRPRIAKDSPRLFFGLLHPMARIGAIALAKGTSSSRQRVPKQSLLGLRAVVPPESQESLQKFWRDREEMYRTRLRELDVLDALGTFRA